VGILKLMWEILPEMKGESLSEIVPEVPFVKTLLNTEIHFVSLLLPSIYITAVNPAVHLLLLITCDANILSSDENVILLKQSEVNNW